MLNKIIVTYILLFSFLLSAKDFKTYSHETGIKIQYSDCLKADDNTETGDVIMFTPSGDCKADYSVGRGTLVDINRDPGYKNLEDFEKEQKKRALFLFKKNQKFGENLGFIYSMVDPEKKTVYR